MKIRNLNLYQRHNSIREGAPDRSYRMGFSDPTNGAALSIRNGRLIESYAKKKIFYKQFM
jgi:hypothetical protein